MNRVAESRPVSVAVLLMTLTVACAPAGSNPEPAQPTAAQSASATSLAELVPYGKEPWPDVITGGQPTREDFEALRDAGLRTVINLRMPTERGTRDEPQWMEDLGLTYSSIPVDGAAGLSEELARQLDRALEAAERPVLVHCGSSNRVGAAFALRAFYLEGASADQALDTGLSAGLTRLEGAVRDRLAE